MPNTRSGNIPGFYGRWHRERFYVTFGSLIFYVGSLFFAGMSPPGPRWRMELAMIPARLAGLLILQGNRRWVAVGSWTFSLWPDGGAAEGWAGFIAFIVTGYMDGIARKRERDTPQPPKDELE